MSKLSASFIVSNVFDLRISTFFFTSDLPTLLTILDVLTVDLIWRLNVIFTLSGIMTSSLKPGVILISICVGLDRQDLVCFPGLMFFLLRLTAGRVLFFANGLSYPLTLILYFYMMFSQYHLEDQDEQFVVYDGLQNF